ncbi:hypothetical protein DFH11DRAFT_1509818 [Phellopilus nigrolimitatus]|nr:hypothetical protein DFH11DRAFT_1518340 [Phellopilus nigrolimitatus]KAH8113984.1 hypothetical protein DFH11DRAFT_1509818 [Phellopilus nigrolimitatus]
MPHFLLHYALAFNPQSTHSYHVAPSLLWDVRLPPEHARLASSPHSRIPSSVLAQPATSPPVPILRIACGLLPHRAWAVEVHSSSTRPGGAVSVGDVLAALHAELRHRVAPAEWRAAPRAHQARVAAAFYARVRAAADPAREQRAGVRRVDWLLSSTVFVGLTPSVERGYTWTLTTKRADK